MGEPYHEKIHHHHQHTMAISSNFEWTQKEVKNALLLFQFLRS